MAAASAPPPPAAAARSRIAIHGGAGVIERCEDDPREGGRATARASAAALDAGYAILEHGGTSLDAVIDRGTHAWRMIRSSTPAAARC